MVEGLLPVSVGLPSFAELTILPDGQLRDELARSLPDPSLEPRPRSRDSRGDEGRPLVVDLCDRLYPLLLSDYSRRLEIVSLAADGPVIRVIGRVIADLEAVRSEGMSLFEDRPA